MFCPTNKQQTTAKENNKYNIITFYGGTFPGTFVFALKANEKWKYIINVDSLLMHCTDIGDGARVENSCSVSNTHIDICNFLLLLHFKSEHLFSFLFSFRCIFWMGRDGIKYNNNSFFILFNFYWSYLESF